MGSMKKRKRSTSRTRDPSSLPPNSRKSAPLTAPSTTTPVSTSTTSTMRDSFTENPFLQLVQPTHDTTSLPSNAKHLNNEICPTTTDVFSNMVQFLDLTRTIPPTKSSDTTTDTTTTTTHPSNETTKNDTKELVEHVARQLFQSIPDHFQEQKDLTINQSHPLQLNQKLISNDDVADLLVPWAMKRILRSSALSSDCKDERHLEWSILAKCTQLACSRTESKNPTTIDSCRFSRHLSLSALQKLVPLAGSVALSQTSCSPMATSCYCLWVQRLYHPPFDTICETLVPLMGKSASHRSHRHKSNSPTNGNPTGQQSSADPTFYQDMVVATLGLLQESLKKANPKKAFQSLMRVDTLAALSDIYHAPSNDSSAIQSSIRTLLKDGLYHSDHHMDGFRSLQLSLPEIGGNDSQVEKETDSLVESPKRTFHCYQDTLLSTVHDAFHALFLPSSSITSKDESKITSIRSLATIIPLLLQEFIEQTSVIQNQKGKKKDTPGKKKNTAKKLTQLQFLVFANMVAPTIRSLERLHPKESNDNNNDDDTNTATVFLQSLHQSVSLLLSHDVYLPSNDDDAGSQCSFLKTLSQNLFGFAQLYPREKVTPKVLPILATTIQLNHLIFHENLPSVIASSLSFGGNQSDQNSVPEETSEFLSTILQTYKRLRQLDHFYGALLAAIAHLRDKMEIPCLRSMSLVLQNPRIVRDFTEAVQSSPIQQTKQIVADYNQWIISDVSTSSTNIGNDAKHEATSLVVQIFSLLLQSLRVDATSASDLSPMCETIISGSVHAMMGDITSLDQVNNCTKLALFLCGWTIDLKNRCDFWLRNSRDETMDDFEIPDSVSIILTEAMNEIMDESGGRNHNCALEELQLLACHRLQQLNARIHEKKRIAFATDADEFGYEHLITETKQVANFALKALQKGQQDDSDFGRRWEILAGALGSWATYTEDSDLQWFLISFFSRVSLIETNDSSTDQAEPALWLLRDANFLETPNVLRNFGPACMSFVASTLSRMLKNTKFKRSSILATILDELADPSGTARRHRRTSTDIDRILGEKVTMMSKASFSPLPLSRALRCLGILENIQGALWEVSGNEVTGAVLEKSLMLDHLCRFVAHNTEGPSQNVAFELVASLRCLLARLLNESRTIQNPGALSPLLSSSKVLLCFFSSTVDMLTVGQVPDCIKRKLLESTQLATTALMFHAMDAELLDEYSRAIKSVYQQSRDDRHKSECRVLFSLGSSILMALTNNKISGSRDNRNAQTICETICDSLLDSAVSLAFEEGARDPHMRHSALVFASEVLRTRLSRGTVQARIQLVQTTLVERCIGALKKMVSDEETMYLSYLIASLAAGSPSKESRSLLFDALLQVEVNSQSILHNALGELVTCTDPEEFGEFIVKLNSMNNQSSASMASRLRVIRLIMLNVTSHDQVELLSKFSRLTFSLALGVMMAPNSSSDGIQEAVELIEVMASKKEIISLRERDLGVILAHVVGTLALTGEIAMAMANQIFKSCFSIVSSILQRFSKQLYSCIPSVIQCLMAFLDLCTSPTNLSDAEVLDRGHMFSRLCELILPHGDFYKKHVLCLAVAFVEALKRNLDPLRRNSLLPAIYCILDILQQHEKLQLNAMLDDMGRALLRSVHENYKKQHVYKGQ